MPKLRTPATEKLGLTRIEAATFLGIPTASFSALVTAGDMPPPRRLGKEAIERWDRREVEDAFRAQPQAGGKPAASKYGDVQ